ncbi:MAG: hypothetical protein P1U70_27320, partial [Saprospiraceae bacterium]|nr:hypothetical protein [Saprospiraceae bacterium]
QKNSFRQIWNLFLSKHLLNGGYSLVSNNFSKKNKKILFLPNLSPFIVVSTIEKQKDVFQTFNIHVQILKNKLTLNLKK